MGKIRTARRNGSRCQPAAAGVEFASDTAHHFRQGVARMTTVVPQNELTRRAIDWIGGQCASGQGPLRRLIEEAAARFNLGPLDVEFLERFYAGSGKGEPRP
jgi:hypothetical protein